VADDRMFKGLKTMELTNLMDRTVWWHDLRTLDRASLMHIIADRGSQN